jgi:hypothetical protein
MPEPSVLASALADALAGLREARADTTDRVIFESLGRTITRAEQALTDTASAAAPTPAEAELGKLKQALSGNPSDERWRSRAEERVQTWLELRAAISGDPEPEDILRVVGPDTPNTGLPLRTADVRSVLEDLAMFAAWSARSPAYVAECPCGRRVSVRTVATSALASAEPDKARLFEVGTLVAQRWSQIHPNDRETAEGGLAELLDELAALQPGALDAMQRTPAEGEGAGE